MRNQRVRILLSAALAAVMLCGTAAAAEEELFFSEEELLFTDGEAGEPSLSENAELPAAGALQRADNQDINEIYQKTAAVLAEQASAPSFDFFEENGKWLIPGLVRGNAQAAPEISGLYREAVCRALEEKDGVLSEEDPGICAGAILALTAMGEDASDFEGCNLLLPLADLDFIKGGGTEGTALTVLALDCHDYEIPEGSGEAVQTTRMGLISYLLGSQQENGGWAYGDDREAPAQSALTALVLQALAPYYGNNSAVTAVTDAALELLSSMQEADGGFGEGGSVSCARLVTALGIMSIDAGKDAAFVKEGGSLLDALLRYEKAEGGFCEETGGEYSMAATVQACCALASYQRFRAGENSLYDMTDVSVSGDLDRAAEAEAAIDRIPGKLSLKDKKTVLDAQTLYQLLTENQKALVDKKKAEKLKKAVARMKELEEEYTPAPTPTPVQEKPLPGNQNGAPPTPTPAPPSGSAPSPTPVPQGAKPSGGTKTLSGPSRTSGTKKTAAGDKDTGAAAKTATAAASEEASEEIREISKAAESVETSMKKLGRLTDTTYTEEQINSILKTYKKYRKLSEEERALVEESRAYAGFLEVLSSLGETWHFDRETGISLKKNEEAGLPWYVKVEAEPLIADEKQMEEIRSVLGRKSELFSLQEIRFVNMLTGREWMPEDILKVKLPIKDTGGYESAVVVHIGEDGALQFLDGRQTGAYLEFEAMDFSMYGVAGFMGSAEELLTPRENRLRPETLPWLLGGGAAVLLVMLMTAYRITDSIKKKKKKKQ